LKRRIVISDLFLFQSFLVSRIFFQSEFTETMVHYPFDFIYARLVLHYLPKADLQKALKQLHSILKPTGHMFVVVRSTDCIESKQGCYHPESGMTTYTSSHGDTYSRYFHTQDSISDFLTKAGFHVTHVKAYDEQLCIDFERTKPSKHIDHLIEVYAHK